MAQVMSFDANPQERLTPRSAATRAKLIAVAERLFAERGVDGVTLNEIGKAAGQRNAAVCQYHFGNKEGLLQAIIDKHVPGIAARRHSLLDQLEQMGRRGLRDVVKAFIYPVAEKLLDADGGRDFIRINAQLVAVHTLGTQHLAASPLKLPLADRLTRTLLDALAEYQLPEPILQQRTLLAAVLLFHGLADHSRMLDAVDHPQAVMDTGLFVQTLEDAIVALLSTPVSASVDQK
ncbi:TetR/AcrR family transcriptional regulator [Denitratisoma oestradiolicum]|uniref:Uncharacterized protein n=1 Tax=Denitratisoma oestradiolicum TaxID=311182 RepID=A0A6S6Y027_9PROT|nr:TetR/AcrR family transcriptional regulator [Denitratisoma oestradiolicum]TWO80077.1 hypothetical protein CBW56_10910 [Denitratisoma oestradiolicum]CAB1370091.1 conserved protein of unknown function [Denitratisoma oestradiolicum]